MDELSALRFITVLFSFIIGVGLGYLTGKKDL